MRNKRVTLIDLGLDRPFDDSMGFVQSTLMSINAGLVSPITDIDFIRTRNFDVIWASMLSPCDVLHIMGHGYSGSNPTFISTDGKTKFDFDLLAKVAQNTGQGIEAYSIIADGCKTATGAWKKTIRDSLEHEIAYIGTNRLVGWHASTVFCSAFYGAYLKAKGKGQTPIDHAYTSATRAIEAFSTITGEKCPYSVSILKPSRKAMSHVVDR